MNVRKIDLVHHDLPTMLWNVSTFLRTVTLNVDNRNKNKIPIFSYIMTFVTAASYFYVYGVSAVWFTVCRCLAVGDVIRAIIMFSLCITSEIGTAKFIYIFMNRNIIREIIEKSLVFDASIPVGSRFANNVLKVLMVVKRRVILCWFVIMVNGTIYVMKPILTPGRHFMDDLFTIYGLEPINDSPNYELGYTLMIASVWFLCYVPANVTSLLVVLCGYIEAQMLALSYELQQVWGDAQDDYNQLNFSVLKQGTTIHINYKEKLLNEFVKQKLQDIVLKHTTNMYHLQMIENVYRGALALEFVLLILGLVAELLGGLKNTYMEIPYAIFQLAVDCYTGQKVMDASEAFTSAVYVCNWENFDVPNKRMVLLMLNNSQRTMRLSAGGMATLSFSSLMNVVRSIYSTYTALQSTLK